MPKTTAMLVKLTFTYRFTVLLMAWESIDEFLVSNAAFCAEFRLGQPVPTAAFIGWALAAIIILATSKAALNHLVVTFRKRICSNDPWCHAKRLDVASEKLQVKPRQIILTFKLWNITLSTTSGNYIWQAFLIICNCILSYYLISVILPEFSYNSEFACIFLCENFWENTDHMNYKFIYSSLKTKIFVYLLTRRLIVLPEDVSYFIRCQKQGFRRGLRTKLMG